MCQSLHRQTNRHSYSRQACAEKLERTPEGGFRQAEVTSCGLNGGPLQGEGRYESRIACNLWSKDGVGRYDGPSPRRRLKAHPYFTQTGGDQYIANMRDGAVAGFKYFQIQGQTTISLETGGDGEGVMQVSDTPEFAQICAEINVKPGMAWEAPLYMEPGVRALYFRFQRAGAAIDS